MRVTKKMLEQRLLTLNSILKRPTTQWQEGQGAKMNVGHLTFDSNGYGIRLVEIVSEGGAERAWSDALQGNRAMFDHLVAIMHGITLRNELTVREANGGHFS
jgi:hypothetical protein